MLSTTDNPFDPFNDFTSWYMFDCEKGHNTCARLARIANVSETMSQKEIILPTSTESGTKAGQNQNGGRHLSTTESRLLRYGRPG